MLEGIKNGGLEGESETAHVMDLLVRKLGLSKYCLVGGSGGDGSLGDPWKGQLLAQDIPDPGVFLDVSEAFDTLKESTYHH
jgi:hypothetical protein